MIPMSPEILEQLRKSYQVVPSFKAGWSVRRYGTDRAETCFETKGSALEWAVERCRGKKADLFIFHQDGTLDDRLSYADSPLPFTKF